MDNTVNNENELEPERPPHPPLYEQLYPTSHQLSPTVVPYDGFVADIDARSIFDIIEKSDKMSLIMLLTNRSNLQRVEICEKYKSIYNKDLIVDLKSILSGDLKDLIISMMTPLPIFYAKELNLSIDGTIKNDSVLIEILCTLSKKEINIVKNEYKKLYNKVLEEDIHDTCTKFKRLMVSLCCANRDVNMTINIESAINDAKKLLNFDTNNNDANVFNDIFVRRNELQLKKIFHEYEKISGHSIETTIKKEFSGDMKKALICIVKCVNNRAVFFAEQLYKSMIGLGTDDRSLQRLILTRSEIDMGEIKQIFQTQYNDTLENFIIDDCSGHYKKCLLALIN
ncbi:hypothetical protein HCN44_007543 [Aphidius gifuensis]|uniref:Annexin n=1 Tax=Aphidius gifuensis TaxID=684658 RepID=A0A835CKR4_APHGI|nr:annexin B11-like [Aphidius gifuensis]KAF7988049.1 hypothetical protein HCN44_007543 [Aphidius gifuensis]